MDLISVTSSIRRFACHSLAKIKSAFEINNIRKGCVTCYMDDIQTSPAYIPSESEPLAGLRKVNQDLIGDL